MFAADESSYESSEDYSFYVSERPLSLLLCECLYLDYYGDCFATKDTCLENVGYRFVYAVLYLLNCLFIIRSRAAAAYYS